MDSNLHSSDKKGDIQHVEDSGLEAIDSLEKGNPTYVVDPKLEKETMRKVDYRLLPILGALYAIALVDRTNISLARSAGMAVELNLLIKERYSIVSLIFFVPYIILELPSNLVLRRFGAARWLSFITVSWGAVMLGMGFVNSWGTLFLCRFLLGSLEAGFFPACAFVISSWYTRFETGKRMSFFYVVSNFISGFSAIFGYALTLIAPAGGYLGWRWIFIVEGIITMVFGVIALFLVVDFPDKATFLRPEQTTLVLERIQKDRGDAEFEAMTWPRFVAAITDAKLWAFALLFLAATLPSYAIAYFLPVILGGIGFSTKDSQLLTAPPYVVAAPIVFVSAYLSDKFRIRGPFIIAMNALCICGCSILAYHPKSGVRYFGVYLALIGAMANVPASLTWSQNSIIGSTKRSVSSALIIAFGGIGGILATTTFFQKEYPRYLTGIWVTVGAQLMSIIISLVLMAYFYRSNKLVQQGSKVIEGRPGFFYTL